MKEKIFNLFLYMGDNNVINQIGVAIHEIIGSDIEKLNFLENAVSSDLESSKKFPIPNKFHSNYWWSKNPRNYIQFVHEDVFNGNWNKLLPLQMIP